MTMVKNQELIKGFSKKTRDEKLAIVTGLLSQSEKAFQTYQSYYHRDPNTQKLLEELSENTISNFPLPYGVAPNFLLNDRLYMVPMVIEESSVIAAASKSAKIWAPRGGFHYEIVDTEKIGQVHFLWHDDKTKLKEGFPELKKKLIADTEAITHNMRKRGGGIKDIEIRDLDNEEPGLMQLYATFETVDAMGANFINSCLEQFSKTFQSWYSEQSWATGDGLEVIMCILSNLTPNSRVRCWVEAEVKDMDGITPGMSGQEFTRRFRLGVQVAKADPHRAVTHNKGILNGVDAVVLATGNDFRAIEACAHAYAAKNGKYSPLTWVDLDDKIFRFTLEIPLALGVVGGLTNLHPLVKLSLELLGNPSARELMGIAAAAGLANNFGAVKSLVTVGIQKGHMKMHLLNILKQYGVSDADRDKYVAYFKDKTVSVHAVRELIEGGVLK